MRRRVAAALAVLLVAGCSRAQASPLRDGGPWRIGYDGYGHVSASTQQGVIRLTLEPARPASPAETHAALVLSRDSWRDFTAQIRVRTNVQLRQPHQNPWEVGWVLWHYANDQHFYYITLKPNGWELGKADPRYPGDQRFLATGAQPVFPVGRWYVVGIRQSGDAIRVDVDGHRLVHFVDTDGPYRSGRIGLYVEDASAAFEPGAIHPSS